MRAVLDINILVRAAPSSEGPAREVVRRLLVSPHVMVSSNIELDELERVLKYPRVRAIHRLDDTGIAQHVSDIANGSQVVQLPKAPSPRVVQGDPDDDPIVAAAVLGGADVICTLDRHLRHPDVVAFCAGHGIRVVTDVELLEMLRAQEAGAAEGC